MNLLFNSTSLTAILLAVFLIGSNGQTTFDNADPDIIIPNIESTYPADGDTDVERGTVIEITFSEEMDTEIINNQTFALQESPKDMEAKEEKDYGEERGFEHEREQQEQEEWEREQEEREREQEEEVEYEEEREFEVERDRTHHEQDKTLDGEKKTIHGTVEVENNTVKFIPNQTLRAHTTYTLTMNGQEMHTQEGVMHERDQEWHDERDQDWREGQEQEQEERDWQQQEQDREWQQDEHGQWSVTFTTGGRDEPLELVDLGAAKEYVILAESSVENEEGSEITGELAKKDDPDREEHQEQEGMERDQEHEQDHAERQDRFGAQQAHANVEQAFEDMLRAYEEIEGLDNPDFTDVFEGQISGKTLTPGLYKFNSSIEIDSTVTLSGSEEDVWIFQVSDDLKIGENVQFQLEDGTTAENVFWQVAGEVNVGSNSHMEGIVLAKNDIKMESQASLNGRMMAQSIILDQNNITDPQRATGFTRTGGM